MVLKFRDKVINQSVSKMEKLQNKALRIINLYSVNSLYNKCEILKFGDSIKFCVLVLHFWTVNTHKLLEIKKVTR